MLRAVDAAAVARRARGENFPVASLLFPRALRPHLRRVYGYCRLVDILGDEAEGDRLELLDELEREVEACYTGEPSWPVMRELAPTIREFDLPREPFLRLIEANRMDQRVSEYETWDDLKWYCVHSADPCGRLVLGLLRRADDPELGRVYLPAEDRRRFGVTELSRANEPLRRLLAFEGERARGLLESGGRRLRVGLGGRIGRAVWLFARGGLAAGGGPERGGYDRF